MAGRIEGWGEQDPDGSWTGCLTVYENGVGQTVRFPGHKTEMAAEAFTRARGKELADRIRKKGSEVSRLFDCREMVVLH